MASPDDANIDSLSLDLTACSIAESGPASAAEDVNTNQSRDMTETRATGTIGLGVFATKDISRGTRIFAEVPIMSTPQVPNGDELSAFCKTLQDLPRSSRMAINNLYSSPVVASQLPSSTRDEIRNWYKANQITDSKGAPLKGKKLQDAVKDAEKRWRIWRTNVVSMGFDGRYGAGVFSLYSRLNHSCVANVHNAYNPTIGRLTVHAKRDIRAGEQILTDYASAMCRTRAQRRKELQPWGFVCECEACTDPAIDALRAKMFRLEQMLAVYELGLSQLWPDFGAVTGVSIIGSPKEALRAARLLEELYLEQGLSGMEMCKLYRDMSICSLKERHYGAAMWYARKELEMERDLVGTETEHMREDMYGAEFWLEHLEQTTRTWGSLEEAQARLFAAYMASGPQRDSDDERA